MLGVLWPSLPWADERLPLDEGEVNDGGAQAFDRVVSDSEMVRELKSVFDEEKDKSALDVMADLLTRHPDDTETITQFQTALRDFVGEFDLMMPEENEEEILVDSEPLEVFRAASDTVEGDARAGGAAGFLDAVTLPWRGAREGLRTCYYWRMKKRAGCRTLPNEQAN